MPKKTSDPKEVMWRNMAVVAGKQTEELIINNYQELDRRAVKADTLSVRPTTSHNFNLQGPAPKVKSTLKHNDALIDSCEDELQDPDQPEFDETTKAAPKARGVKKAKSKKSVSAEVDPLAPDGGE